MRYPKQKDPFYGSEAWARAREAALLRDHYWCARCGRRAATTVHHIQPRKLRPDLALALDNLQSLCPRCHNQLHPERGRRGGESPGLPSGVRVIEIK